MNYVNKTHLDAIRDVILHLQVNIPLNHDTVSYSDRK